MSAQAIAGLVTPDDTAARFADDRSGREYAPSIADADIFVCPRRTHRLGSAILESMGCSVPVALNSSQRTTRQSPLRKAKSGGNAPKRQKEGTDEMPSMR